MISSARASSDRGMVRPIAFEERQRTGSTFGRFRDREGDALRPDLSVGYDGAVIAYQWPARPGSHRHQRAAVQGTANIPIRRD
jgi:hypothetical protein